MRAKVTEYLINRLQKVIETKKQVTIIQLSNSPTDYLRVEHIVTLILMSSVLWMDISPQWN